MQLCLGVLSHSTEELGFLLKRITFLQLSWFNALFSTELYCVSWSSLHFKSFQVIEQSGVLEAPGLTHNNIPTVVTTAVGQMVKFLLFWLWFCLLNHSESSRWVNIGLHSHIVLILLWVANLDICYPSTWLVVFTVRIHRLRLWKYDVISANVIDLINFMLICFS